MWADLGRFRAREQRDLELGLLSKGQSELLQSRQRSIAAQTTTDTPQ